MVSFVKTKSKDWLFFYIHSSMHVAFAIVGMLAITSLQWNVEVSFLDYVMAFCSAFVAYNFTKYGAVLVGFSSKKTTRLLKAISVLTCFGGIVLSLLYFTYQIEVRILFFVVMLLTFSYTIRLPYFTKPLREIPGVKIHIVSLCWVGITVLFPFIKQEVEFDFQLIIICFYRYVLMLIWILFFEIKDLATDLYKLRTIPQQIGVAKTKLVMLVLIVILYAISWFWFKTPLEDGFLFALMLYFIYKIELKNSRYFALFWIEMLPFYWLFIWYLKSLFIGS